MSRILIDSGFSNKPGVDEMLVDDADIGGGLHAVSSIALRDAIPTNRLKLAMLVSVLDDGSGQRKIYRLISLSPKTWEEATAAGPVTVHNASGGTVDLAALPSQIVVHESATAATYRFTSSPTDGMKVKVVVDSVTGTGSLTFDGHGKNVDDGEQRGATIGPTNEILAVTAIFDATDDVWRLS